MGSLSGSKWSKLTNEQHTSSKAAWSVLATLETFCNRELSSRKMHSLPTDFCLPRRSLISGYFLTQQQSKKISAAKYLTPRHREKIRQS